MDSSPLEAPIEMPTVKARMTVAQRLDIQPTEVLTKSEIALQKRCENLKAVGVTRKKVYQTLKEGLTAVRVVEDCDKMGDPVLKEVPDFATRHKYMETALKVLGDLVEVKTEVNVDASSKTLQISASESEELERLRAQVYGVSQIEENRK